MRKINVHKKLKLLLTFLHIQNSRKQTGRHLLFTSSESTTSRPLTELVYLGIINNSKCISVKKIVTTVMNVRERFRVRFIQWANFDILFNSDNYSFILQFFHGSFAKPLSSTSYFPSEKPEVALKILKNLLYRIIKIAIESSLWNLFVEKFAEICNMFKKSK